MINRIKRIFSNSNEKVDAFLIVNNQHPNIDLNFFYVSGITSGAFEGCIIIGKSNGKGYLLTSELEEPIARKETKLEVLGGLLNQKDFNKVLVFGRTKHGVEKLSKMLLCRGFKAESIHGNKNNSQRQRALNLFKDNRIQVLVATDVAARGLDIADISHVINYDLPSTYDDYIHRIGRTGRYNKRGTALTFID